MSASHRQAHGKTTLGTSPTHSYRVCGDRMYGSERAMTRQRIGTTKALSCAWMAGKKEFSAVVVKLSRVTIQRGVRSVGVAGKEPGWMDWCRLKEDYEGS